MYNTINLSLTLVFTGVAVLSTCINRAFKYSAKRCFPLVKMLCSFIGGVLPLFLGG